MPAPEHDHDHEDHPDRELGLDALARRAAADLHAAVATYVADDGRGSEGRFVPARLVARRRTARLALAAAALVVAVVGVGVVAVGDVDDDDETIVADEGVGTVRVVPTRLPDGLRLIDVGDGSSTAPDGEPLLPYETWTGLWGSGVGADAFAGGDLFVNVLSTVGFDRSVNEDADELVPVMVGAVTGYYDDMANGARGLGFEPTDDLVVIVTSYQLGDEQLLAAAQSLTFAAGEIEPTIDLATFPVGLEQLASVRSFGTVLPSLIAGPANDLAATVWAADGRQVIVAALDHADEELELVNRYALGPDSVAVTVAGRPGWQSANGASVIWRASSTVLVAVFSAGLDAAEVLDVAESVQPVDDDTWAALHQTADANAGSAGDRPVDELGVPVDAPRIGGSLPDGRRWVVYLDADGLVCATLESAAGASTACADAFGGPQVLNDDGVPIVVYGVAALGVAEVRADVGGMRISAALPESQSEQLWVLDLVTAGVEEVPTEVVEVDAEGNEVRRLPIR